MPITIAIDGFSSCGKSTLAKDLAASMGYVYVDSGAMYRAVTLHFLRMSIDVNDADKVEQGLSDLRLDFRSEGTHQRVLLNGKIVEKELRSMAVNKLVSPVATLSNVRAELVRQQQYIGRNGGIVMDGRDIGTVVFPDAELKLFITADTQERVRRRVEELKRMGSPTPAKEVETNLSERDRIDSTRDDSPLRKAEGVVVIDNTNLTREEQAAMCLALAKHRA
jgi:cytidylate kinase